MPTEQIRFRFVYIKKGMKNLIIGCIVVIAVSGACKSHMNKPEKDNERQMDTAMTSPDTSRNSAMGATYVNVIADRYLNLKNSLGDNNSADAAKAGIELEKSLKEYSLSINGNSPDSGNTLLDDAREHAEHIGKNKGNIAHQREHFDFLSRDMYDLLKSKRSHSDLYKMNCPAYNHGKGAFWISENGDKRNPYFGKSMPADSNGERLR
jgi:hypothetical protein